jgi:anti-sigma B factor antagonist
MLDDMPQHLEIETQETPEAGVKTIALIGGLTLETVSAFNLKLREETAPVILLDLSKLEWLDSAGVGALVQLLVRRAKGKSSLALAGLSPRNNAVLQVAHVLNLFSVFPTAEDALAYFAKHGSMSDGASISA